MSEERDAVLKTMRGLVDRNAMTKATHFPECWKYHYLCALGVALDIAEQAVPYEPCEPCQKGYHADCTGYCSSNCCVLQAYIDDDGVSSENHANVGDRVELRIFSGPGEVSAVVSAGIAWEKHNDDSWRGFVTTAGPVNPTIVAT